MYGTQESAGFGGAIVIAQLWRNTIGRSGHLAEEEPPDLHPGTHPAPPQISDSQEHGPTLANHVRKDRKLWAVFGGDVPNGTNVLAGIGLSCSWSDQAGGARFTAAFGAILYLVADSTICRCFRCFLYRLDDPTGPALRRVGPSGQVFQASVRRCFACLFVLV